MNIGRTSNPALNRNTFTSNVFTADTSEVMTLSGTVNKIFIMLLFVMAGASFTWGRFFNAYDLQSGASAVSGLMILGGIGGLITAIVTVFRKKAAKITAPLYAIFQGLFLGGLSAFFEAQYPGIVIQAVGVTFGVLFALLLAYKSGYIKATENFKLGVAAATGGIFLFYMVSFVLSIFGVQIGYFQSNSGLSIILSLVVVVIAALNLVLDFDFIEKGAESGAPKYMEWYAAFGLMVTLIWLYIEMLRLLSKLASRD